MDEQTTKRAEVGAPVVRRPMGRTPIVFAVLSLAVALVAGFLYFRNEASAPPPRSPEETVREFLSGVFLAGSPERVAPFVCASWEPANAISRTTQEVGPDVRVSWDDLTVVSTDPGRTTVRARLGLRRPDDASPSTYRHWRFDLVDQNGWKVCEARPIVV